MSSSATPKLLTSIPARRLELASRIGTDIELKLDWEDYSLLSNERSLLDALQEANLAPDRVRSVHLPPGLKTRGRKIGMAATRANVGAILDFVHAQLADLPDAFLVMHPPREFDFGDQLTLLKELCELTGREITIENPPDASYWYTPEDIAFFSFLGATYDDWSQLYVTVDSKHLPADRSLDDAIDDEAMSVLYDRLCDSIGQDVEGLWKAFNGDLVGNVSEFRSDDLESHPPSGWSPLLNTLVLSGPQVKSVHFNDPIEDGIPDLDGHNRSETLDAVRELVLAQEIFIVLEANRELFDRPNEFVERVAAVDQWLRNG